MSPALFTDAGGLVDTDLASHRNSPSCVERETAPRSEASPLIHGFLTEIRSRIGRNEYNGDTPGCDVSLLRLVEIDANWRRRRPLTSRPLLYRFADPKVCAAFGDRVSGRRQGRKLFSTPPRSKALTPLEQMGRYGQPNGVRQKSWPSALQLGRTQPIARRVKDGVEILAPNIAVRRRPGR